MCEMATLHIKTHELDWCPRNRTAIAHIDSKLISSQLKCFVFVLYLFVLFIVTVKITFGLI